MIDPFVANNIRLDIENAPSGLVNLIDNPSGDLGGWAWYAAPMIAAGIPDPAGQGSALQFSNTTGPAMDFLFNNYSRRFQLTPGSWVAARAQVRSIPTGTTGTLAVLFYDAAGNTTRAAASVSLAVGLRSIPAVQVPAGTVEGELEVNINFTNTTQANRRLVIREIAAAEGTQAAVTNMPVPAPLGYTDRAPVAYSIAVKRGELTAGTVEADIRSAAIDPATSAVLRGNRRVRVTAPLNGVHTPIYSGRLADVPVKYSLTDRDPITRSRIALQGVDAAADLADLQGYFSVARIADVADILAWNGNGGPWLVNGSSAGVLPYGRTFTSPDDKAIDQIALVRDSTLGYVWVNRDGVLVANDAAQMPIASVGTLTEADTGSDLDVTFDLASVINQVTIMVRRLNAATGEIVEIPYGPYRDSASIRQWGTRAATMTVFGIPETTAALTAYANKIFAANAQPKLRINTVRVQVAKAADLARHKSHIELYDLIRVVNPTNGIDQTLRVTSIEHDITPERWIITLGFGDSGNIATPQQISPPGRIVPQYDNWTPLPLAAGFVASDVSPVPEFKILGGVLYIRGRVKRSNGSNFTAGVGFNIGTLPFDVPLTGNDRSPAPAPITGDLSAIGSVFINSADYSVSVTAGQPTANIHVRGQFPL